MFDACTLFMFTVPKPWHSGGRSCSPFKELVQGLSLHHPLLQTQLWASLLTSSLHWTGMARSHLWGRITSPGITSSPAPVRLDTASARSVVLQLLPGQLILFACWRLCLSPGLQMVPW